MPSAGAGHIADLLTHHQGELLAEWIDEQTNNANAQSSLLDKGELAEQCKEFLALMRDAAKSGDPTNIEGAAWDRLREMLEALSRSRAVQGFTPSEVARFVFSLKRPLLTKLREEIANEPDALLTEIMVVSSLLDDLGLFTTEVYQSAREEVIMLQQRDMLELSTPVVKLWEGILALPMIGTLDSARTQVVMETLLQRIVETGADIAIIDITGVPTVDTLVAQHLLKTVAAARLMGADCIISGIRPQIAQTIVHLGVDLSGVTTKATLADAFTLALRRRGATVGGVQARG